MTHRTNNRRGGPRTLALLALMAAMAVLPGEPSARAQQRGGDIHVLPIRGNVSMIVGAGGNITVSTGADGLLLVDAGSEMMAAQVLAVLQELGRETTAAAPLTTCVGPSCYPAGSLGPFLPFGWSSSSYNAVIASPRPPKPIRWIIQTSADPEHTGGTASISAAGTTYNGGEAGRLVGTRTPATIIGHENVLKRMTLAKMPELDWPSETYYIPSYKMSQHVNGEGIQMFHVPAAITDADTIVQFRFSDVISAGDLFTPGQYPKIDVAKGGTVQGLMDGLNKIIDLAFPEYRHQGGTMIVSGHGRLGDTADVAIFRNMVEVVRDRVRDLKKKGMSLSQVRAAKPTLDYDGIYGSPDAFIEAVYQTLENDK
jgi:glyoxylase-like metal-dependent hydrolase (beta-lactamase superfamily II)